MYNLEQAKKLTIEFINEDYEALDDELILIEKNTIFKCYGWIFFYDSKKFLDTRIEGFRIIGNSPVLFEKESGHIEELGTALPVGDYIDQYEQRMKK